MIAVQCNSCKKTCSTTVVDGRVMRPLGWTHLTIANHLDMEFDLCTECSCKPMKFGGIEITPSWATESHDSVDVLPFCVLCALKDNRRRLAETVFRADAMCLGHFAAAAGIAGRTNLLVEGK